MPQWKDKARDNLRAAHCLVDAGLIDPAATRTYYALYHAAVHRLEATGRRPETFKAGARWWEHDIVRNNAALLRGKRSDRDILVRAHMLRVKADYETAAVDGVDLSISLHAVESLVEDLCS
jgi:uncharacterized protein (UPF0332 family)